NARIIYNPTQTGLFRVIATSFQSNSTGQFQLTVQELDAGKGGVPVAGGKIFGGAFDPEFKDEAPAGSMLVGLEIGLGKFVKNDVVKSIRPIYRDDQGAETKGNVYGKDVKRAVSLKAKPGYAVGGFTVRAGLGIDAITLTFMKVKDGQLDPKDSYQSEI